MSDQITLNQILLDQLINGKRPAGPFSSRQMKVLENIALCGTAYYGFSKCTCQDCGHSEIHYGTCSDPNCPTCGGAKRRKWVSRQNEKAIAATAWHIIFTVPDRYLNRIALHDQRFFYNALFKASAKAIEKLSADPKYFGAKKTGFFSCLHTWGSTLSFHPHIHMVFYGAGLDEAGELVRCPYGTNFIFPAKVLAKVFKQEMMKILRRRYETNGSCWIWDLADAGRAAWNVQIQKGQDNPRNAINYLGRYVNRTAISNSRIHGYDGKYVTFEYKDYRDHGSHKNTDGSEDRCACVKKEMTLSAGEFIRRFALHIPPRQFRRVRFYGFLSTTQKKTLERMKELTGTPDVICESESPGIDEALLKEAANGWDKCKKCSGPMERSGFKERSSRRSLDPKRYLLALRSRKATMDNQPKTI